MKIGKTDQWQLDGDCSQCRRKNYCSKPCTKNKRKTSAMWQGLVANKLNEMTGGVYGEIMEHSVYR